MLETDTLDKKLLHLLRRTPLSTQDLAQRFSVPRTTMGYRLRRLEKRGSVARKKVPNSNGSLWQAKAETIYGKQYIRVIEGSDFYKGYVALWKLPKGSVVYALQGRDTIRAEYKALSKRFIAQAQRVYKRKNIIVKALVHERALDFVDIFNESMLSEHVGRSIGVKFLLDKPGFRNTAEIMCAPTFVVLGCIRRRRMIIIQDRDIAAFIYQIVGLLYEMSDQSRILTEAFDLNQFFYTKLALRKKGTKTAPTQSS